MYFICPVTLLPASSGKDGKGYLIKNPRGWIVKLAPIIHLSLCILKVALTAYGIPFPIPHFIGTIITNELRGEIFDQVSSIVKDVVKDSPDNLVSNSIEIIDNNLENLTNSQLSSSSSSSSSLSLITKNTTSLKNETDKLYSEEFHHLLFELENKKTNISYYSDWKPKYTGLNLEVGADGTTAWVSNEGRDFFLSQGQNSFK